MHRFPVDWEKVPCQILRTSKQGKEEKYRPKFFNRGRLYFLAEKSLVFTYFTNYIRLPVLLQSYCV